MSCLLVAGLGNPGVKYQNTRHNIGFMVLDSLSGELGFCFSFDKKINAEVGAWQTDSNKIFFLKPCSFMNLSGECIAPFASYFNIEYVLVIHDDIDIAFGDIRFKYGGSSGGHNGLKSIDKMMGNEYFRLRFGVGRGDGNVAEYVLSNFGTSEKDKILPLITCSKKAILHFCSLKHSDVYATLASLQNNFTIRDKSHKTT